MLEDYLFYGILLACQKLVIFILRKKTHDYKYKNQHIQLTKTKYNKKLIDKSTTFATSKNIFGYGSEHTTVSNKKWVRI